MYFFVYYTSVVVFDANVRGYKVEFFSTSTAQKWSYECPEELCELPDISPFDYKISLSKSGYEPQVVQTKIFPRKKQEFIINFEKKAQLKEVSVEETSETIEQKIARISTQNDYYEVFDIWNGEKILFLERWDTLEMLHERNSVQEMIRNFSKVSKEDIDIQRVYAADDIFLRVWDRKFLFYSQTKKISELSFGLEIDYIKTSPIDYVYLVVTSKGTFVYNIRENTSNFSYLFKDYVFLGEEIIGIIYEDEQQKKENFNFEKSWNLVIKYSPETKERKIIYTSFETIEKIYQQEEGVFLEIEGKIFQLENYE